MKSYNIFDPYVDYDNTVVSAEYRKLIESINQRMTSRRGVTQVGGVFSNGSTHISTNTACHAGLSYFPKQGGTLKYIVSAQQTPSDNRVTKENSRSFIDWLINRSPYAKAFVDKDADKIWGNYFLLDPNQTSNYMVGAAITTRFFTEGSNSDLIVWNELTGLPNFKEDHAFIFSRCFKASLGNPYPIMASPGSESHTGILLSLQDVDVSRNFINRKITDSGDKYYKTHHYSDISGVWGGNRHVYGNTSAKAIGKLASNLRPKVLKKHMSYNIFDLGTNKTAKQFYNISNPNDLQDVFEQFVELIDGRL
jgi:hypothetical protein